MESVALFAFFLGLTTWFTVIVANRELGFRVFVSDPLTIVVPILAFLWLLVFIYHT